MHVWACSAASTRRLGPERAQVQHVHDRHRRADPARDRLRHGRRSATAADDGEAVIAYFGDGATSQGDVNEAFVWAAVFNAPVVFFCQNNQYAISEPLERQTRVPLYQRAAGFGFPGVRVDGNDVLAVLAVTRAALDAPATARARRSSRRTPTGWARTPPPTTRPATGSPARSRPGRPRTRSPG